MAIKKAPPDANHALRGARQAVGYQFRGTKNMLVNVLKGNFDAMERTLNDYGTIGMTRQEQHHFDTAREELKTVAKRLQFLERQMLDDR